MDRDAERRRPCPARPPPVRRLVVPLLCAGDLPAATGDSAGASSALASATYTSNRQPQLLYATATTAAAEQWTHDTCDICARLCEATPSAPSSGAILERQLVQPARLTIRQTRRAEINMTMASSAALKVGYLNVRSLTAHLDEVNHLLLREQIDVLCLGETWLTEAVDSSMLLFPGYVICRRDRRLKKTGGGVAIVYRDTLKAERMRVPTADSTLEALWLQITGRSTIVVCALYRPPSGPPTPAIEDLHHQLTHVLAHDRPTYVLGDVNFDVLQPSKPGVSSYIQHISDLSLHQLVTMPTHPGPTPSLIDHLITNRPDLTAGTQVTSCDISDHDLITALVSNVKHRHRPETITVRSTRHLDHNALCLSFLLEDWSEFDEADSITDKWNSFLAVWDRVINIHMPMKTIKLKNRPHPWLEDDEVREAMDARDRARADRDHTPCEETAKEYRDCRNAVKMALNRACTSYYATSFRRSRSKTWKDIRQFLISSNKSQPRTTRTTPTDPEWADRLNRFFASVGSDVAGGDIHEALLPRPPRVCDGAFKPHPATLPELSAALQRMGSSRACGADGITVQMLRMAFPTVGPHLLSLVNCSIVTCDLPASWKAAVVTALHKKGDTDDPNNYRPISVLPVVAKLCERVVCTQLMTYVPVEASYFVPAAVWFSTGLVHRGGPARRCHVRHREHR